MMQVMMDIDDFGKTVNLRLMLKFRVAKQPGNPLIDVHPSPFLNRYTFTGFYLQIHILYITRNIGDILISWTLITLLLKQHLFKNYWPI